jgi:hypothetical protein
MIILQTTGLSMNEFAVFLPLAGFWVVFDSLNKATQFVNSLRDTIVTGVSGGTELSTEHKRALLYDWRLSMVGTVFACFLFAGILIFIGEHLYWAAATKGAAEMLFGTSSFPFFSGVFFVLCGVSDQKLILKTIAASALSEETDESV